MVREASWPGRLHGQGMCSSSNAFSCLRSGLPPGLPHSGASARGLIHGNCRRSRHGRRRWCRVSRRKGASLAGTALLPGCMARALMCWRRWRPVGGPRPSWPSLRRRAAGSNGRQRRSRPSRLRGKCGRSVRGCQRRSLHSASQRWPHPAPRGSGIGGRSQKGPKGQWRLPLRVTVCRYVRTVSQSAPSGSCSSGPVDLSRPLPRRFVMHRPVRRFARCSGSGVCGGQWTRVLRQGT